MPRAGFLRGLSREDLMKEGATSKPTTVERAGEILMARQQAASGQGGKVASLLEWKHHHPLAGKPS